MRQINEMKNGNLYVPQILDLIISEDNGKINSDTRIYIVMEYFDYDLR